MVTSATQKKCHNCEELIHPYATSCPYCGHELEPERAEVVDPEEMEVPPAPYKLHSNQEQPDYAESPFRLVGSETIAQTAEEETPFKKEERQEEVVSSKTDPLDVLKTLSLLLGGMVFFLFGLALVLFSRNGVLTLHWNGNWWPFYLICSIPMLYIGWRSLHELDESGQ